VDAGTKLEFLKAAQRKEFRPMEFDFEVLISACIITLWLSALWQRRIQVAMVAPVKW
jgi:hypothetical protein